MKKNFILSIIIFLTNIILAYSETLDCGDKFTCELITETGVLTISGLGDFNKSFYNNKSIKSVIIENGITSIGNNVFEDCSSLTSITIPDSVTSIGEETFSCCSSLTSITIPDSVTKIENEAFYGCSSLTSITVDNKNSYYSSIDDVLFNKDGTELILYPLGNTQTSYVIPNSVTSIERFAFYNHEFLTSITIPNSVKKIGIKSFSDCKSLTSITIPGSVTEIGYWAFSYCSSLTSITIPDSLTSVGYHAFEGCNSLTSITIPNSVVSNIHNIFSSYSYLTSITISDSVTEIGSSAFSGCNSLTSITIPDSVTEIGSRAFEGCSSLTSITIPDSVTEIGSYAFEGCSSLENVIYYGKKSPSFSSGIFSNTKVKKISVPIDYIGDTFCGINVEPIETTEPGYYINRNDLNTFKKCTNSGCETLPKPTEPERCTSDNDGKLIYDGSAVGLCTKINELITKDDGSQEVKEDHYTVIPFATTETNYLVHHAINGEVFNFDRTPSNVYYVVKSNKNGIVFNPEISEKDHCADRDGKLMDRLTDFCSDNSSGMYYTCVNGKCTSEYQTKIGQFENNGEKECTCTGITASENCATNKNAAGYYLYETNLYEYKSGENKCTKVDEPVDGYYWNDHQYNQLVECINGSCKAFTPKLKDDTTDTSKSDLLVDTGYNIKFNDESLSSMLFKQSNEDYQYKISGHPNTAFADPEVVYNIKVDKNSVIIDVNGSDPEDPEDPKDPKEPEEPTMDDPNVNVGPGFYKITGTNKYKQCDSTGCNEVTLETECKTSTIGKLFTIDSKVALCLNFFDNQPIWTYATASDHTKFEMVKLLIEYALKHKINLKYNKYFIENKPKIKILLQNYEKERKIRKKYGAIPDGDLAVVLYNHNGTSSDELSFRKNENLMVTNWDVGDGYAFGYKRNNPKKKGKFPSLLVQKCLENKVNPSKSTVPLNLIQTYYSKMKRSSLLSVASSHFSFSSSPNTTPLLGEPPTATAPYDNRLSVISETTSYLSISSSPSVTSSDATLYQQNKQIATAPLVTSVENIHNERNFENDQAKSEHTLTFGDEI